VVRPHPPIQRALRQTVEQLKQQGIRIIDWPAFEHQEAWELISTLYFCNGATDEHDLLALGNEETMPLTEWLLGQPTVKSRTLKETNGFIATREMYRARYVQLWNDKEAEIKQSVDCILTAVAPSVAYQHNTGKWWSYTSTWNLLDYPAAVFPVTSVDVTKDHPETGYVPRNCFDEENHRLYTSAEVYAEAPVSLQVVCRRFNDEKVLECLRLIERAIGRH
jgi:amidase